jgi:hypothetical protein
MSVAANWTGLRRDGRICTAIEADHVSKKAFFLKKEAKASC